MNGRLAAARRWLFELEGSTRALGVLRAGTALLIWAEFGQQMAFFTDSRPGAVAVAVSLYLSSALLLVGWRSRTAVVWTGLSLFAVWHYSAGTLGRSELNHYHNVLLMTFMLTLAFSPCGASFSIDRWLAVRRAARESLAPPREWGALWTQRLLALEVSAVYFWAAYDKLSLPFLSGARLEHYYIRYYAGSESFGGAPVQPLLVVLATGVMVLEFALAFGLHFPRWQRWLMPLGVLMHAAFYVTLPLQIFSCLMGLYYLAFIPPAAFHRFVDEMLAAQPAPEV